MIRLRDSEFLEKDIAHLAAVMLAGMDDLVPEAISRPLQRPHYRGDLHKVGPGTSYRAEKLLWRLRHGDRYFP